MTRLSEVIVDLFRTAEAPAERLEIDTTTASEIRFYSGNAAERWPGSIRADVATYASGVLPSLVLSGIRTSAANVAPRLVLAGSNSTAVQVEADEFTVSPAGGGLYPFKVDRVVGRVEVNTAELKWNGGDVRPAGEVTMHAQAGNTQPPNGWLMCSGQAVSRTTYARLFAAIGTTYGAGDNSTTFNVPNLKGRVVVGNSGGAGPAGDSAFWTNGSTGGAKTVTLTEAQMPSHGHSVYNTGSGGQAVVGSASYLTASGGSFYAIGGTVYAAAIGNTGGGAAHENMPPYVVMNYIIKT